jgi:protein O-GlcNAc transferase
MADRTTIAEKLHDVARLIQAGQSEAAEPNCVSLVQSSPREAWAWFYLGLIRLGRSQPQDAEPAFKQAVDLCPTEPLFWTHLGIAVRLQARAAEAEGYCRWATMLDRTNGVHWVNLGGTLLDQQRFQEAAQAYREALECNGNDALAWSFLGAAEQSREQLDSAQQAYERSLDILPNNVDALTKYASLLCIRREWQRALAALLKALSLDPQSAPSWMVLGITCEAMGDMGPAEAAYRQAVQIAPQYLQARYSLAKVLLAGFALIEAEATIREILTIHPQYADAYTLQASIHWCAGEPELALDLSRRSLSVRLNAFNHSKVLQCLHYAGAEPEQLLEEHRKWDSIYARLLMPQVLPRPRRRADDSIRIGFVSSHFGRHPISFLALPGLEALDKSRCAVVCYADQLNEDQYANRFKAIADMWRTTGALVDAEFAEQIRRDEIDILVDLMGYTGNRLLVFARKPAPMQVTWLGYVGTTGFSAMDFLLADRFHVKPGEESWHTEKVLRLPDGHCCYGPPTDSSAIGPLPAIDERQFTFASFNNPAKFSAGILDAWASILQQVPESRLMLKYNGLDQPEVQRRIISKSEV